MSRVRAASRLLPSAFPCDGQSAALRPVVRPTDYAHAVPPRPARERPRRRLVALVLLLCAIAAGLGIHYAAPAGTLSDMSGDILYAVAAYLAVVILAPRLPPLVVGTIAAGWCVLIELFQLTGIPLQLGTAFPPSMLVLGTVFDARDIALYLATAALLTAVDAVSSPRFAASSR